MDLLRYVNMLAERIAGNGKNGASLIPLHSHSRLAERSVVVASAHLFAGLSERECSAIASHARARSFAKNESLFSQGEPMRELILLQSGIAKHTQVGVNGNEVLLRFSRKGDVVNLQGESARTLTCSARATETCSALVWDFSLIQSFLTRYPAMRINISRILAEQLYELEERFREVATENASCRLALVLLRLLKQIGKPSSEGTRLSMSREELAQMTGLTVFTISRVLSAWSEQRLIVSRRESVVVTDPTRLQTHSDGFPLFGESTRGSP
jgi:CRP/FNR family transcriptional regulator, nitrogen oxide reductase regulator